MTGLNEQVSGYAAVQLADTAAKEARADERRKVWGEAANLAERELGACCDTKELIKFADKLRALAAEKG